LTRAGADGIADYAGEDNVKKFRDLVEQGRKA
jgi:hypothetical protein